MFLLYIWCEIKSWKIINTPRYICKNLSISFVETTPFVYLQKRKRYFLYSKSYFRRKMCYYNLINDSYLFPEKKKKKTLETNVLHQKEKSWWRFIFKNDTEFYSFLKLGAIEGDYFLKWNRILKLRFELIFEGEWVYCWGFTVYD